mmetsp:Transcript_6035/g.11241  ORF Transcript_6035/g.11241 Transcript_6035/m.11241 type:complete len:223 (+) Transcript_6035:369-1037(+)
MGNLPKGQQAATEHCVDPQISCCCSGPHQWGQGPGNGPHPGVAPVDPLQRGVKAHIGDQGCQAKITGQGIGPKVEDNGAYDCCTAHRRKSMGYCYNTQYEWSTSRPWHQSVYPPFNHLIEAIRAHALQCGTCHQCYEGHGEYWPPTHVIWHKCCEYHQTRESDFAKLEININQLPVRGCRCASHDRRGVLHCAHLWRIFGGILPNTSGLSIFDVLRLNITRR